MQPTHRQPHATPIPDDLVSAILAEATGSPQPGGFEVNRHGEFSNDVAVVTLSSGRRLMVKRGRHPWSGERFSVARRASRLLRTRAGIVAPDPLELSAGLREAPVEAYWRIELPLFADLWKDLDDESRYAAMRSLGALMQRIHAATAAPARTGEGDVAHRPGDEADRAPEPFSFDAVRRDLTARLRPAIEGEWPVALELLDRLLESAPTIFARSEGRPVVLHGDLHVGNVLCRADDGEVRCVGLLDLEWVHEGPAESDFARFEVMHRGPFDMEIEPHALKWVYDGYDRPLEPGLVAFYSLYHYLNLGLYSAVIGDAWHAEAVAAAARPLAEALPRA